MSFKINFPRIQVFALILVFLISCSERRQKSISILFTTDIHGVFFPYDFVEKEEMEVSLAGVSSYVNKVRDENNAVLLLDNGDNLQGQPVVYYYNFIDTVSPHLNAEIMNFLDYDAGTVGNHDIEAGHAVYDRLVDEYDFPLLAANAINSETGRPYFNPYTIIEKKGIRIAVFGLITPAVPDWLPPELYSGMEFREMVETAKFYMPAILKEKPDLVIGLFHSGWTDREDMSHNKYTEEDGTASVAWNVPGFDIILCGHDHSVLNKKIVNSAGDTVLILDGGSRAEKIGRVDVIFSAERLNGKRRKSMVGKIIDTDNYEPDPGFINKFTDQKNAILDYVNKKIASSETTFSTRDSYFGSSSFVDMIHSIQLEITNADISFAAPLSFDVKISSGPVTVGDMFKLYRFENLLYTMSMSGLEIKKYLEFSYSEWFNTMKGPDDLLLKYRISDDGKPVLTDGKAWLKNQPYNFDSAAGIDYIVDVSKPEGERISIKSFSNNRSFEMNKTYLVAVNSYRGNGGGGHFISGAGISKDELSTRLIASTERDLRYFILNSLENMKIIKPVPFNNWKIVPEEWVKRAIPREYELLFGK